MKKKIIISFTSYPKRINTVINVLSSLFNQTIKPDKIILWLSLQEFPQKEKNLPLNLIEILGSNGFNICWVKENFKSHKKYYYALQEYTDDIIITIDDDMYYSETMIEELLNTYYKYPNAISARNVHMIVKDGKKISRYEQWDGQCIEYKGKKRADLCAIGCSGILYPSNISNKRWFDKKVIEKYCPDQDDLWLKFNQILDGISVAYSEVTSEDYIIENTQDTALYKKNVHGNKNNICVEKLFGWTKVRDNKLAKEWFDNLYDYTFYYKRQRELILSDLCKLLTNYSKHKIYICGAGKFARVLLRVFGYCCQLDRISGMIVTNYEENYDVIGDIPIKLIENIEFDNKTVVICGVGKKNRKELKPYFDKQSCIWVDVDIYNIVYYFEYIHI